MSEFVLDLIVENKRLNGEWVESDDPESNWAGVRFLVKPATTAMAERVQKIQALSKGGKNLVKFSEALLKDILVDVEGIGVGDRAATVEEAIAYFAQLPSFVSWLMDQSLALATRKRGEAEADLGN